MINKTIIVIGAGMSGIMATRTLHEAGYRVTCLEGRARIGGRTHLPSLDDLPSDIVDEMAQLAFLTDAELEQAAKITVTAQEVERMETLLFKLQREGLTAAEQEEANQLLHRSDQIMLVRAQAMLLLTERGLDISTLKVSHLLRQ